jgi:tRNA(Ile)-lysidine synthase
MTGSDPVRMAPLDASSADCVEASLEHFLDTCSRPCRILIALSGGGDSVGLLTALARISARRPNGGLDLIAATVDHGLRPGSREEAMAAGRLAGSLGVAHAILEWTGEKPHTGVQAAAREARYQLLARHALANAADIIVTGHNLEDNHETRQMRLARNADQNVHGMAEAVLLFGAVWAARPLIGVRREAIRDYLRAQGTPWAEDPSNANPTFERVRLRQAPDGRSPRDFTALMRMRRQRMQAAARLLDVRARVIGLKVGLVDLSELSPNDPALLDALGALAALLGGRDHPPGREGRAAMADFLASSGRRQMTMARVAFDRRGDLLYLQREIRDLPTITLAAGKGAIWDHRLRIVNAGEGGLLIGGSPDGEALIDPGCFDGLPARVRQLALSTGPHGRWSGVKGPQITPFLSGCDKFLPLERLELGNVLAKLMGLPHFPSPIFRHQA